MITFIIDIYCKTFTWIICRCFIILLKDIRYCTSANIFISIFINYDFPGRCLFSIFNFSCLTTLLDRCCNCFIIKILWFIIGLRSVVSLCRYSIFCFINCKVLSTFRKVTVINISTVCKCNHFTIFHSWYFIIKTFICFWNYASLIWRGNYIICIF